MMRIEPAGLALVWAHLEAKNRPTLEHEYTLLVQETLSGMVWAGVSGGSPLVLGGVLVPSGTSPGTAWLSVVEGLAPTTFLQAALLMRSVIRVAAAHAPGVVCCIDRNNQPGARLGRALGFAPTDRHLGDLVEWSWHGRYRRDGHGQRRAQAALAG